MTAIAWRHLALCGCALMLVGSFAASCSESEVGPTVRVTRTPNMRVLLTARAFSATQGAVEQIGTATQEAVEMAQATHEAATSDARMSVHDWEAFSDAMTESALETWAVQDATLAADFAAERAAERAADMTQAAREAQDYQDYMREQEDCDPSYPTVCIPPVSVVGDLDCDDLDVWYFEVVDPDPHGFDGDYDGIGCEV